MVVDDLIRGGVCVCVFTWISDHGWFAHDWPRRIYRISNALAHHHWVKVFSLHKQTQRLEFSILKTEKRRNYLNVSDCFSWKWISVSIYCWNVANGVGSDLAVALHEMPEGVFDHALNPYGKVACYQRVGRMLDKLGMVVLGRRAQHVPQQRIVANHSDFCLQLFPVWMHIVQFIL